MISTRALFFLCQLLLGLVLVAAPAQADLWTSGSTGGFVTSASDASDLGKGVSFSYSADTSGAGTLAYSLDGATLLSLTSVAYVPSITMGSSASPTDVMAFNYQLASPVEVSGITYTSGFALVELSDPTGNAISYSVSITPSGVVVTTNISFSSFTVTNYTLNLTNGTDTLILSGLTTPLAVTNQIDFQSSAVPIPGAAWLLGAGLVSMAGLRRRLL